MASPSNGKNGAILLPEKGNAKVKNVMSGDTVVLWGKAPGPGLAPPQVQFTLEGVLAPRLASKNYPNEDPGAFPSREYLRSMLVGKLVSFQVIRRKPVTSGGNANETQYYHFGHIFFDDQNVALKVVGNGHAKVKDEIINAAERDEEGTNKDNDPEMVEYRKKCIQEHKKAIDGKLGIHGASPSVRSLSDLQESALQTFLEKTGNKQVKCVIEHIFDGSRYRCQVVDSAVEAEHLNASFTLLVSGIACPRPARPSDPASQSEECADQAKLFAEQRVLQRELMISFHGTDKPVMGAVCTVHHPKGNIAVELLKNGLARISDWSVRLIKPVDVPPLRQAENSAKRSNLGVWHSYKPPQLSGASQIVGTVIEIVNGDTVVVLPTDKKYDSEDVLEKVSLASIRAPRVGNERTGRADEPYAAECKDRLRQLVIGKQVKIQVHFEREIPIRPEVIEKRQCGTVAVGKRADVGLALVNEGLAQSQRHRDEDEKSPNYDNLLLAEATAKAAKKGIHSDAEYKKANINDLTDPKKAKANSGSLTRSGGMKAVVDYVFNGSRYKLYVPSENCFIMFAPTCIRCPQPSPTPGAKTTRAAEPFGDASKRHARMNVLNRNVEISCSGVTNGGVITGTIHVGTGAQRRDFAQELVSLGLANVDQRSIDYGEASKSIVDAQTSAQGLKLGIWSIERVVKENKDKPVEKAAEKVINILLSEIRSGSHFYYHVKDDESSKVMEDSMKLFTENNGTDGAPCDVKAGKVVAALFDDGSGKSWYRAKILEKKGTDKVSVLFIDHGNVATLPLATHLRPLDDALAADRIPPVAKEAVLALTITPSLEKDEGVDAARMLQQVGWGKELTAKVLGSDIDGNTAVALYASDLNNGETSINEEMVSAGFARVANPRVVDGLARNVKNKSQVTDLASKLNEAQESARKGRAGMWRYGDVGDDDPAEI